MYAFNSKNALPTYCSIAGAPNYFLLFLFLDQAKEETHGLIWKDFNIRTRESANAKTCAQDIHTFEYSFMKNKYEKYSVSNNL